MSDKIQVTMAVRDSGNAGVLYMAIEMGEKSWKLLFSNGEPKRNGQIRVYQKSVDGNDYVALGAAVRKAKELFELGEGAVAVSCYEAGQQFIACPLHLYTPCSWLSKRSA